MNTNHKKKIRTAAIAIGLLLIPGTISYIQQGGYKRIQPELPRGTPLLAAAPESPTLTAAGKAQSLSFDLLKSWTYVEKKNTPIPAEIRALDGQTVEMIGFMVPLSEVQNITQFTLAPSLWGCCYGQPPAVNHMIVVNMPKGQTSKFYSGAISVRGVFHCGETRQEGYLVSLYTITAQSITSHD